MRNGPLIGDHWLLLPMTKFKHDEISSTFLSHLMANDIATINNIRSMLPWGIMTHLSLFSNLISSIWVISSTVAALEPLHLTMLQNIHLLACIHISSDFQNAHKPSFSWWYEHDYEYRMSSPMGVNGTVHELSPSLDQPIIPGLFAAKWAFSKSVVFLNVSPHSSTHFVRRFFNVFSPFRSKYLSKLLKYASY